MTSSEKKTGGSGNVDDDIDKYRLSEEDLANVRLNFPQFTSDYEDQKDRERKRGRVNGSWGVLPRGLEKKKSVINDMEADPGPKCRLTVSCIDDILQLCIAHDCSASFVDGLFSILNDSVIQSETSE
ncbi:hypothetical protein KC19_VG212400 [Ceratodon purpureus]|uniref:Uncharacterized protein n=1 Tax=Ceratodon purpureus TaxID=3225 RepID=A0A8T0HTI1_CERPU|nr:hypothetical protein KC19_VG212400 [Ceratodon purpureus]